MLLPLSTAFEGNEQNSMAMTANKILSVFISNGISEAQSNKKVKKIASNQPRTITARTSLFTKTEDAAPPQSQNPVS